MTSRSCLPPRRSSLSWWRGAHASGLSLGLLFAVLACSAEPEGGVVVEKVETWGLAAASRIEPGDRIFAWQTDDAGGEIHDPLELLWIESKHASRTPVTLRIDRSGDLLQPVLEDSGWHLEVRPTLGRKALATYRAALESEDPDEAHRAWGRLGELLASESVVKRRWAAWRQAKAAFVAGEVEDAREMMERARAATERAELRIVLDLEEGEGLTKNRRFAETLEPFERAIGALAEMTEASPLYALTLSRRAAMLSSLQPSEEAHRISATALEILEEHPRAKNFRGHATNNRGMVFHFEGDLEQAASYYRRVVEDLPGIDDARKATTGYNLGLIRESQGYYERADELLENALARAEDLQLPHSQIGAMLNALGILNKNMGAIEQSSEYFRRSLAYLPSGGVYEADVRMNLGNLHVDREDLQSAEENTRTALSIYQQFSPDSVDESMALHNLGRIVDRMGRSNEAEDLLRRALAMEEELFPESALRATTMTVLGAVRLRKGDPEEALELLTSAYSLEQRVSPTGSVTAETLFVLGDVELALGRPESAIEVWRRGLEDIDRLREQVPGMQGKARFLVSYDEYHLKLAEVLLEQGRAEQAFLTLERSRARMMRAMLRQQESRFAMRQAPAIESQRRQLDARIRRVLAQLGQLHAPDAAEQRLELQEQLQALKVERERITEQLHLESPGLERLDQSSEVSIPRIRSELPSGTLGLSFMLGSRASFLFVISPWSSAPGSAETGVEVFEILISRQEVESRVSIFRSLIERGRDQPELEPALVQQAAGLFDQLLGPIRDRIDAASGLYIAPDATLATLPFAGLVHSREPLAFFAEWKPHAIVPSLTILADLATAEVTRPRAEYDLVAVGDAQFDGSGRYGTLELDPLPGSRDEVEQIAELFATGNKVLLAGEATESAVRDLLPKARYVHFATHAILDRRFPLDSSLALALVDELTDQGDDGLMHAWEIMESPPLAAELVALAGCETGLGAEWAGEGLVGLTQAFHYLGVPDILASQWRVGDVWVGELTRPFYSGLRSGQLPMEALAYAQRRMIRSSNETLRHPFFWASFTLYGASLAGDDGSIPGARPSSVVAAHTAAALRHPWLGAVPPES